MSPCFLTAIILQNGGKKKRFLAEQRRCVSLVTILTISDLILSNSKEISSFIILSAIIAAFAIGIASYKDKLWQYIKNRRNRCWFIYGLLSLALIIVFRQHQWLSGYWLLVTVAVWISYIVAITLSLRPKHFEKYTNPTLRKYEKWLSAGESLEHIEYFRRPSHWFFLTAEEKLEYSMLGSSYFQDIAAFDDAYRALEKIKDTWLYDEERRTVQLQRAILLVQMGSLKAAYQILGDPEKNDSNDPMVWFAYSFIFENKGDIDRALLYAEKSRDIVESGYHGSNLIIAEVYNTYSHIAMCKGNRQEALRYIDTAWHKVQQSKDMRTIHIVASNRIAQMAMAGRSRAECEAALKAYRDIIPSGSITNKLAYNNCEINYYRLCGDTKREYELIKSGYKELIPQLNHSQRILYNASTFCMLMNGHFEHAWFDKNVKAEASAYDSLPLLDRLTAYKEYMGLFQQEEFRAVCTKRPYKKLRKTIMKYYHEKAIAEIDEAISVTEPYQRHQYRTLMLHKLGILKLIEGKGHINNSKGLYLDLYYELYDAGLHQDAVHVLMTLIDECTSPYNVLIQHPVWPGAMYFSDYIACAPPAPEPQLDSDGIHLRYDHLPLPNPYAIIPLQKDVIVKHIDIVIAEFRSWKNHPYKVELSIEIARILMALERPNEAREFLQFFNNSGVSVYQLSSSMREIVIGLKKELRC